jgi:hypothetical protein
VTDAELDARIAELRDRVEQERPQSWVPEQPGDEIAGELLRYGRGTARGKEAIIAVLRTPEGVERSVWVLGTVLEREFAELQPKAGELLLIRYLGKRESTTGESSYREFRIEAERDEAPIDWSTIGAKAGAETASPATTDRPRVHEPLGEADKAPEGEDEIPF